MNKLTDLIPLLEQGYTIKQLAEHFNKSIPSINNYIYRLRKAGYKIDIKMGRPPLRVD